MGNNSNNSHNLITIVPVDIMVIIVMVIVTVVTIIMKDRYGHMGAAWEYNCAARHALAGPPWRVATSANRGFLLVTEAYMNAKIMLGPI